MCKCGRGMSYNNQENGKKATAMTTTTRQTIYLQRARNQIYEL